MPYLEKLKFQRGGLWLHHLHRQLRTAADGGSPGDRRKRPGRRFGALGQSQLRRPHQFRSPRQLPDVAAAGGCVCAGRPHRRRPAQGSHRQRQRRRSRVPRRHLAHAARSGGDHAEVDFLRDVQPQLWRGLSGRRALARLPVPKGETYAWEKTLPTSARRPTSTTWR